MKLKKSEVEKIASLARIELSEDEKKKFQKELSSILDYIDKLSEVDTDGVEPTYQVTGLRNIWREDEIFGCDAKVRQELLNNMPDKKDNYLKVPAVFKERNKK